MTSSPTVSAKSHKSASAKLAMQVIIGALVGAVSMFAALQFIGKSGALSLKGDEILTIGTAVVYLIMGLFVLLGVLFPKPGAALLNVEDSDELIEQRRLLGWSGAGCILIGVSALALVLASPSLAVLSPVVGATVFGLSLAGLLVTSAITRRDIDEFGQRLSTDSNSTFLVLFGLVFGTWAAAAHLGYASMFSALTFYGGTLALYLLAVFWVVGRRGLLAPRG